MAGTGPRADCGGFAAARQEIHPPECIVGSVSMANHLLDVCEMLPDPPGYAPTRHLGKIRESKHFGSCLGSFPMRRAARPAMFPVPRSLTRCQAARGNDPKDLPRCTRTMHGRLGVPMGTKQRPTACRLPVVADAVGRPETYTRSPSGSYNGSIFGCDFERPLQFEPTHGA